MSNPFKAIGKVFKKVVKVVKKVAVPALAIGAAVLTGGAALGVLPSIGALGAKVGLSAGLSSILSTAGQGALLGGGLSLVTGGNPLKGATRGFLAGGLMGATGLMTDPLGLEGMAATNGGLAGTTGVLPDPTGPLSAQGIADGAMAAAGGAPATATGLGLDSLAQAGSSVTSAATPITAGSLPSGIAELASKAGPIVSTAPASTGGFLGLGNMNPLIAAQLIQGVGGGLAAGAEAKERRREREQRRENYSDTSGLFSDDWGSDIGPMQRNYRWSIDKVTGQPFKEYLS